MDPRRGKATRTGSKPGAAAPQVSAPSAKGAPTKPSESRVVPEAARPDAQKCGSTRSSGSQRKKCAQRPQERPPVRARGAGAEKVPLSAEDAVDGLAGLAGGPEPPLPRAGSRRERGTAGSALNRRPPPAPTEVLGLDPLDPVPSLGGREVAPGDWNPRAVLEKLRLRRQEISAAAEIVNKVVDHLLRRLQTCESEFKGVALLHTGSYYEHVKVSGPVPALLFPRPPLPHPFPSFPDIVLLPVSHLPLEITHTLIHCSFVYSSLHPTNREPTHIDC